MIPYCGTGTCGRCGVCTRFAAMMRKMKLDRIDNWLRIAGHWRHQDIARRLRLERKRITGKLNAIERRYPALDVPLFFTGLSRISAMQK